jgi:DNA-binding response OmpR family regulator
VLICDGEELALDLLEHHLTGAGYEVMRAADGGAAMQCLAERTPAVVILAVMTRVLSGIEVLQRIRESPTQGHLPVMMLTRRDSEEDVVEALRLGASDYITKPFMVGEVLERISKHITPYEHPLDTHVHDLAA